MLGAKAYHGLACGAAAATLVVLIPGARFRRREDEESRTSCPRVAARSDVRREGRRERSIDAVLTSMTSDHPLTQPLDDAATTLAERRGAPLVDPHDLAMEADWGDMVLSPEASAAPFGSSGVERLDVTPIGPPIATRADEPCVGAALARRRAVRAARRMVPPRPSARSSAWPSDRSFWRWRLPLAAVLMTVSAWFGLLAWKTDSGPNARTGTNPASESTASPSDWALTTYTKSIERVAPGELVPEDRLHGDNDLTLGIVVDPPIWRRIVLRCPKTDGSHADGNLLRPLWWLREQLDATRAEDRGASRDPAPLTPDEILRLERDLVGAKFHIAVPECGVDGLAEVLEVHPCPAIPRVPGTRVVTGTWRHHSARVIDLWIEGLDGPIGTTVNHPFWSEDRLAFVRADELQDGERLHLLSGGATPLARHAARPGLHEVFNLEVQCDHVYHVTSHGVLVHNGVLAGSDLCRMLAGGGKAPKKGTFGPRSVGAAQVPEPKVLQTGERTITNRTRKALGLTQDEAKRAMEGLKDELLQRPSHHQHKILDNGDVLDSNTGDLLGNLFDYLS